MSRVLPKQEVIRCVREAIRGLSQQYTAPPEYYVELFSRLLDYPNKCRGEPCFSVGHLRLAIDVGIVPTNSIEWETFVKAVSVLVMCRVVDVVGSLLDPGSDTVINYRVDAYDRAHTTRNRGVDRAPQEVRTSGKSSGDRRSTATQRRITDFT